MKALDINTLIQGAKAKGANPKAKAASLSQGKGNDEFASLLDALSAGKNSEVEAKDVDALKVLLGKGEQSAELKAKLLAAQADGKALQLTEGADVLNPNVSFDAESTIAKQLGKDIVFDGKKFIDQNGKEISSEELRLMAKDGKLPNAEFELENVQAKFPKPLNVKVAQNKKSTRLQSGQDFMKNINTVDKNQIIPADVIDIKSGKPKLGLNHYQKGMNEMSNQFIRPKSVLGEQRQFSVEPSMDHHSLLGENRIEQVMLNQDSGSESESQLNQGDVKVLDLSGTNTRNTSEIINKITNYISQNAVENANELEVVVKHDQLGQFKVNVQKAGGQGQVDLQISTATKEGQNFFVQHEAELVKSLSQAGVRLSDVKVISSNEGLLAGSTAGENKGNSQGNFSSGHQGFSSSQGGANQHRQENSDSQRRRQLWQEYKEQASVA